MKPPGTYKIRYQRRDGLPRVALHALSPADRAESVLARMVGAERRVRRIVDSLRDEIAGSGDGSVLRVRQVFTTPREIFRVEIERPELGYQRTTLLDREALEVLLEAEEVRSAVELALSA